MANAPQLKKKCVFIIRNMLGTVTQLEPWACLPDHLQDLVLRRTRPAP